jgi:hypothetical protein
MPSQQFLINRRTARQRHTAIGCEKNAAAEHMPAETIALAAAAATGM